ncbi:P-loop containing nucleoside triphosphate hydrolase protein [Cercophora newfieldiana]|uniref:P-loop containing nucleoside triphosphate hydrolase protein n=1 Tax=Cercophora newfieldiana TaxID=92897 RepID=A0AA40CLN5_9PEZI|nr:P-loop containing nucleoside triphosphate hydrolase protein [Cercophora newfieldiana]
MEESAGFVILMGMTGAGKSTFISRLTGLQDEVGVGHSLSSTTSETACFTARYDDKRIIHLIDTPGFDDTTRSDADILNTIAARLATLYRAHQPLLGIVFLHRITDVRLSGSAIKNFNILQRICGPQNYDRIVLATTMWGEAAIRKGGTEAATGREDRLWDYWTDMFQGKSRTVRHEDDTQESAQKILSYLIDHPSASQPLQIQRELVDQRMTLDQTDAGRYVRRELLMAKEKLDRELAELQRAVEDTTRMKNAESLRAMDPPKEVIRVQPVDIIPSAKRKRTDDGEPSGQPEYFRRPSLRSGSGSGSGTANYWRMEGSQYSAGQQDSPKQQADEWTRYIPKMILNWFPGSEPGRAGGFGVMASRWPWFSKPGESTLSLAYGDPHEAATGSKTIRD